MNTWNGKDNSIKLKNDFFYLGTFSNTQNWFGGEFGENEQRLVEKSKFREKITHQAL